MTKWEDLSTIEREKYVNQDYVGITYNFLYDVDSFSDEDITIAEKSAAYCVDEYGVEDLLCLLTEKQKEAVVLYYLKGKSEYKIAEQLGITRSAIEKRLTMARKKLRRRYDELKNECNVRA